MSRRLSADDRSPPGLPHREAGRLCDRAGGGRRQAVASRKMAGSPDGGPIGREQK
jgi:hypothetical protein